MDLSRRNFVKASVTTGLLASLAGCARPPSGSGLQGLSQDQMTLLQDASWTSANANIGNTRVNETGTPRAGVSTTNWGEMIAESEDSSVGAVYEPVVDERGNVFLAGPDAAVHCYDFESGEEKWSVDLPDLPAGAPSYDDVQQGFSSNEFLYVTTEDGTLVGINPGSGSSVFETDVGTACSTGPTAVGDACYVYVDDPGKLVAVESSGDLLWEVGDFGNSPTYPPALGDELLYVQTGRGLLGIAPDSNTDEPGVAVTISDTARSPPVVEGETVYFAGGQGRIHAHEVTVNNSGGFEAFSDTGDNGDEDDETASTEHVFRAELLEPSTGEIAVDSQHVYSVMENGSVEAISKTDGEYAWRSSPNGDDEFTSLSVCGTVVYATATNGGLYVLSTINGDVLNHYTVESPFGTSLTPVGDSLLASVDGSGTDILAGDSETAASTDGEQQLLSMETELTADPLHPRFDETISRAQAVDHLSVSNEATWTSELQAEELTREAVQRFEEGVEEGDVTITDADAALQKMLASMAVSGEFMLTFSSEMNWPSPEQVDGMEAIPDNGLPVNRARSEGVGFEMSRAALVIPYHFIMTFGGPIMRTLKFIGARTGVNTQSLSSGVSSAVDTVVSWLKKRNVISDLKTFLGGENSLAISAFSFLRVMATTVRRIIVNGNEYARQKIRNTNVLQEAEKDFIIENFIGADAIKAYTTSTSSGIAADYTGLSDLVQDLFDAFGEMLNKRVQSVIESDALEEIDPEENTHDSEFTERRVQYHIQDITNEQRYTEAARGNVETDRVVIQQELSDVIHEYEQTAIGYSNLRDSIDVWDEVAWNQVYGLSPDVIDLTGALYGDHDGYRAEVSAIRTIIGSGWSFLRSFLTVFEEAMNLGFGIAGVFEIMRSHSDGVNRIQNL